MSEQAIASDGINAAIAINQAHGVKIDAGNAIRSVANGVRNAIAAHAGQAQGAIAKAQRSAQEKIAKQIGKAQGAVDGVVADVGNTIRGTIENAIAPLIDLGVTLPSDRQIQEIKRQQIIDQQAVGQTDTGGGVCDRPARCDVHNAPADQIDSYDTLGLVAGGYLVYPHGPVVCLGHPMPQVIRVFKHWWQAELACRLLTECRLSIQDLIPRWRCIDDTQLAGGNLGSFMGPLCGQFIKACDEYLAYLHLATPSKPLAAGEIAATGDILPDGYCKYCDDTGGIHIYPCNAETLPVGWKRC